MKFTATLFTLGLGLAGLASAATGPSTNLKPAPLTAAAPLGTATATLLPQGTPPAALLNRSPESATAVTPPKTAAVAPAPVKAKLVAKHSPRASKKKKHLPRRLLGKRPVMTRKGLQAALKQKHGARSAQAFCAAEYPANSRGQRNAALQKHYRACLKKRKG